MNQKNDERRDQAKEPAERPAEPRPQTGDNKENEKGEGSFRNVETAVNNPSYFGDDYEVEQEEEMSREEAKSEDENDVAKSRRKNGQ